MVSRGIQEIRCSAKERFKRLRMELSPQDEGKVVKSIEWRRVRSQTTNNQTKEEEKV